MTHQLFQHEYKHSLSELYIAQVLYGFGSAMITIFVPIYLLVSGFDLAQAFLYFIVFKGAQAAWSIPVAMLNYKLGFKRTVLWHIPFFVVGYFLLYEVSLGNVYFLIPALLIGMANAFYFVPMNTLFLHYSDKKHRGSEVGMLNGLRSFFRVLSPAVGGFIAATQGFEALFLFAVLIVTISAVPLFMSSDFKAKSPFNIRDLWKVRHHEFVAATIADGFGYVATTILFPLLMFIALGSTESVGFIESLGVLIFAGVSMFTGKLIDKQNRLSWLRAALVFFALTIGVRYFLTTTLGFVSVIIVGSVAGAIYVTSHETLLFDYGTRQKDKADEFIVIREILLNVGRMIALGLAIIFPWHMGFLFAMGALLLAASALRGKKIGTG